MHKAYSSSEFEQRFHYTGSDLGALWSPEKTLFRLWAPTADRVLINLYKSGDPNAHDRITQINMERSINGTWIAAQSGDLHGVYYKTVEACDPYARTTGVNGHRAMIIDLNAAVNVVLEVEV